MSRKKKTQTERKDTKALFMAYWLKRLHDTLFTVSTYGLEWEQELARKYYPLIENIGKRADVDFTTGSLPPGTDIEEEYNDYIDTNHMLMAEITDHYEQDGTSIKADMLAKKGNINYAELIDYLIKINEGMERLSADEREKEEALNQQYFESLYNYTTAAGLDFTQVKLTYDYITLVDSIFYFQNVATSYKIGDNFTVLDFPESEFTEAFKEMLPEIGDHILQYEKRKEAAEEETENLPEQPRRELAFVPVRKLQYPITKVDSNFWNMLSSQDDGQQAFYQLEIDVSRENDKERRKDPALVVINLDLQELKEHGVSISKPLDTYTKIVFIICNSLRAAGNERISFNRILEYMGQKNPAPNQREKLAQAIDVLRFAKVDFQNITEAKKYKYEKHTWSSYLMPCEVESIEVGGRIERYLIPAKGEPRLISYARSKNQISQIKKELLLLPFSVTNANYALWDYFIDRCEHIKNGSADTNKTLLSTVYERLHITGKVQKSRAYDKIEDLMKDFKEKGYIVTYYLDKQAVTIFIGKLYKHILERIKADAYGGNMAYKYKAECNACGILYKDTTSDKIRGKVEDFLKALVKEGTIKGYQCDSEEFFITV